MTRDMGDDPTTISARPRVVKRIRGKKMPPNTKYVGRGSRYGNPYIIGQPHPSTGSPMTREQVIDLYEAYINREIAEGRLSLSPLKGVNHACWCHTWDGLPPNPRYCHADITLELANA